MIRENAEKFVREYYIGSKDALHLACALHSQCRWFITTDKELLKKCTNMRASVISPIDFIRIYGEEYYDKDR